MIGSALSKELVEAGVLLVFYNPLKIRPFRITPNFFRTHRKILVVDSAVAFTGGMGIALRMKEWRDTNVKVVGDSAVAIGRSFQKMWENAIAHKYRRFEKPNEAALFTVYTNAPRFLGRYFYDTLLKKIQTAKKSVYLSTPYFVPSIRLVRALRSAAKRGVDVQILVPMVSDVRLADLAAHFFFEKLLKANVKIYRYTETVLHAKTAVIDEVWASVGSANLDNSSLVFNYELNVGSMDSSFVSELGSQFETDTAHAEKLELHEWHQRSFLQKCKEFFVAAIHSVL
jgi:cardiolipin synthase